MPGFTPSRSFYSGSRRSPRADAAMLRAIRRYREKHLDVDHVRTTRSCCRSRQRQAHYDCKLGAIVLSRVRWTTVSRSRFRAASGRHTPRSRRGCVVHWHIVPTHPTGNNMEAPRHRICRTRKATIAPKGSFADEGPVRVACQNAPTWIRAPTDADGVLAAAEISGPAATPRFLRSCVFCAWRAVATTVPMWRLAVHSVTDAVSSATCRVESRRGARSQPSTKVSVR